LFGPGLREVSASLCNARDPAFGGDGPVKGPVAHSWLASPEVVEIQHDIDCVEAV